MATKRPADLKPSPKLSQEELDELEFEAAEDNLYLSPDGTMTTYHEGDEEDPNSEWYENPPSIRIGSTVIPVTDLN